MNLLPDTSELLSLEKKVGAEGTNLTPEDLIGCWQLQLTWSKLETKPKAFNSMLLRGLGARLEINVKGDNLQINNSINVGALELRFSGRSQLSKRKRQVLTFSFDELRFSFAKRLLFQQQLPMPAPGREPFFALIARNPSGWLAARGRGGGLALWTLQDK